MYTFQAKNYSSGRAMKTVTFQAATKEGAIVEATRLLGSEKHGAPTESSRGQKVAVIGVKLIK